MKRIIAAIALVLLCLGAHAQINIVGVAHTDKIMTFRSGFCGLYVNDLDDYYVTLNTTNRFDDLFVLNIGRGWQSAVQTLADIDDLLRKIDKNDMVIFSVTTPNEIHEYTVYRYHKGVLAFHADGYAGIITLTNYELASMIDKLCTMNR